MFSQQVLQGCQGDDPGLTAGIKPHPAQVDQCHIVPPPTQEPRTKAQPGGVAVGVAQPGANGQPQANPSVCPLCRLSVQQVMGR